VGSVACSETRPDDHPVFQDEPHGFLSEDQHDAPAWAADPSCSPKVTMKLIRSRDAVPPTKPMTARFIIFFLLIALMGLTQAGGAPKASTTQLAQTPPMGWNSWDSYGLRINEQQFRDNVEVLATKLHSFGYTYAVIVQIGLNRRSPDKKRRVSSASEVKVNDYYAQCQIA
jgi:hypothetical protein